MKKKKKEANIIYKPCQRSQRRYLGAVYALKHTHTYTEKGEEENKNKLINNEWREKMALRKVTNHTQT